MYIKSSKYLPGLIYLYKLYVYYTVKVGILDKQINALPPPLPLSNYLGALTGALGCFPLDNGAYPPQSHWQIVHLVFLVCNDLVPNYQPAYVTVLYP